MLNGSSSLHFAAAVTACFLIGLLPLNGCVHLSHYPPSKYIGLVDVYNGIPNGQLPGNQVSFSGKWETKYPNSSAVFLCGNYRDGLPDGQWFKFYFCGNPHLAGYYAAGQKKQSISYYPDGIPQFVQIGTEATVSYDPDGKLLNDSSPAVQKRNMDGWTWSIIHRLSPFHKSKIVSDQNREINIFLFLFPDNSFALWYYVNEKHDMSKGVIRGILNSQSGNLESISLKKYYGGVDAEFSWSNKEALLTMELILSDAKTKLTAFQIQTKLAASAQKETMCDASISTAFY